MFNITIPFNVWKDSGGTWHAKWQDGPDLVIEASAASFEALVGDAIRPAIAALNPSYANAAFTVTFFEPAS